MTSRLLLLVACAGLLVTVVPAATSQSTIPFMVGFAEDLPKEIGAGATDPGRALGATAWRLTTQWSPGRTELDASERSRLDLAVAATAGLRVFLSVYGTAGTDAPRDAAARDGYCGFVRGVLLRYPAIRDVVIWNEPNKRLFWNPQVDAAGASLAPGDYASLLARCYDVLHATVPGVRVHGLALSSTGNDDAGSHSPGAFIRKVGDAYRASGRTAPILDGVAFHPYPLAPDERPWTRHIGSTTIGQGDWNKLMLNLSRAFSGTAQPIPGACAGGVCPSIWYLETGFQTRIDPARAGAYTGSETVARVLAADAGGEPGSPPPSGSAAPDQRTQVVDATRLAACQPYVAGILQFLVADEPRLEGWQSGALWADRAAKPSAPFFSSAFAEASSGSVDCDALKGGPPSGDYTPPPAPSAPAATAAEGPLRVELSWAPVGDPSSPVSYRVYRNGALVTTVSTPAWADLSVVRSTAYRYTVRGLDAAGNLGDASPQLELTTPAAPPSPPSPGEPAPAGGGGAPVVPADLRVRVEPQAAELAPGQEVEVRVTVANAPGAQTAVDAQATVTLQGGLALLGLPYVERGPGCSASPGLVCSLDFLPPGLETPLRFSIEAGEGGEKIVRVEVSAANEGNPADNVATAILTVRSVKPQRLPLSARGVSRTGSRGADRLVGTAWSDSLLGGRGDDLLLGRGGADLLVGGPGRDRILGGAGDDRIRARDGSRDLVSCGPGRDTATADRLDTVARDCERASVG